jgi:hypothetical protein
LSTLPAPALRQRTAASRPKGGFALLADKLQENNLAAVRGLPKRYAEVDKGPFIASISITPIAKAAAGKG